MFGAGFRSVEVQGAERGGKLREEIVKIGFGEKAVGGNVAG